MDDNDENASTDEDVNDDDEDNAEDEELKMAFSDIKYKYSKNACNNDELKAGTNYEYAAFKKNMKIFQNPIKTMRIRY